MSIASNHTSGELFLAYNPSTRERDPLALATSIDAGRTWRTLVTLDGHSLLHRVSSFAYPTVLVTGTRVLVTYSASTHDGIRLSMVDVGRW